MTKKSSIHNFISNHIEKFVVGTMILIILAGIAAAVYPTWRFRKDVAILSELWGTTPEQTAAFLRHSGGRMDTFPTPHKPR